MKDSVYLLLTGLGVAAFCAITIRLLGEYYFPTMLSVFVFALILDNRRLYKKLKDLGHPDDFATRVAAFREKKKNKKG